MRKYSRERSQKPAVKAYKKEWQNKNRTRIAAADKDRKSCAAGLAYRRAWWAKNRERLRVKRQKAYHLNIEVHRERGRQWAAAHKGEAVARATKWYQQNKDQADAYHRERRAKKRGGGGRFTAAEWRTMKALCGHKCLKCGTPDTKKPLSQDHIVPLVKGGRARMGQHPASLLDVQYF